MSFTDRCRHNFTSKSVQRGTSYFGNSCVTIHSTSDERISAVVMGSQLYEVNVDWSDAADGVLVVSCTCPHFDDGNACKHIWATLLQANLNRVYERVPGNNRLDFEFEYAEFDDDDDEEDWEDDEGIHAARHTFAPKSSPESVPTASALWKKQLTTLSTNHAHNRDHGRSRNSAPKRNEVWYILNVGASVELQSLVIDLKQREEKKNGGFGVLKQLSVRRSKLDDLTDEEDRRLVGLLLGNETAAYSNYSYYESINRVRVAPGMYDVLLPMLCAHDRFVWALDSSMPIDDAQHPLRDDGPPWKFRVQFKSVAKEKCWKLSGELYRDNETVELAEPVLMLEAGLVLFPDKLAQLDPDGQFHWLANFQRTSLIKIPFDERNEFLNQLKTLPSFPFDKFPRNFKVKRIKPRPRGKLVIGKPSRYDRNLQANVFFQYGDVVIPHRDQSSCQYDQSSNVLLTRDPQFERELISQLMATPAQESYYYSVRGDSDVHFAAAKLGHVVLPLVEQNWIVESEAGRFRQPGSVSLSVQSNIGWFELDGQIDFDGSTVSLPKLLDAVHKNQKFVRLDDGSQGILPEQWLKRYGVIANLGVADGERVKFSPTQALLLDSMLADQPNARVDQKFARFRKKLSSFDGVKPRNQPRGFRGQLRNYQQEGLGWLHFLSEFGFGGCLADDMGLGKTVQVLALLESRRTRRVPKGQPRTPSVVVVPKSLVFNWIDEAGRFTPKLRVLNYTGLDRAGTLDDLSRVDLIVTTYGTLRRDIAEIQKVAFDYAILDESQAIKNANAQSAKACRLINADHRLAMTGTPIENHIGELWSLFEFLNPGMLGRSAAFNAATKKSRDPDGAMLPVLSKSLRPYLLRRTKEQVLTELPKKTEQTIVCEMSKKERKLYDELRGYYHSNLSKRVRDQGLQKAKIHVLEALLRLRQAACHPGLLDEAMIDEPSAKLDALMEQLSEIISEGHKALVFSQFTSLLAIVRKKLDGQKITYEYLDGKTRKRADRVKRFQEDETCPLFLISLKAGGQGLNLTAADYVFILDPWWNPASEAQAIDRAHRIGQTRRVFAYRLICRDTVEDKILKLQKGKRELADAIVSADNSVIRNLTAEDLQLLLS